MPRTVRQEIVALLEAREWTPRELADRLGLRERELADHLPHVARTLRAGGRRLAVQPAECLACGYLFRDRRRLTAPGRCPRCKSLRIDPPAYRVE